MGISTVAIYIESEKNSGYVKMADEHISLGNGELTTTFLNIEKIIAIALATGSSAIHPGYGFLSEDPNFAKACEDNHLIFIGPNSEILKLTGNKPETKELAASLGIPVLYSRKIDPQSFSEKDEWLFPVIIKASSGGGGKGMKVVCNQAELQTEARKSSRIALKYFGAGALFVEQFVKEARHIEIQLLGDQFGSLIHLYERECSIQRNHQKILEEAPARSVAPALLEKLYADALKIGKAVGYWGAGTVEFLVDPLGNHFFIEMNPRIQVEHAVTEQITGVDLVREQLLVASGFPLSFTQDQIVQQGHAIETRIYAEDPAQNFAPSPNTLQFVNLPVDPKLRVEADLLFNGQAGNQFDPLLLKLITWDENREKAIRLMQEKISELNVIGPVTNINYLENILSHSEFSHDKVSVGFCSSRHLDLIRQENENTTTSILPFLLGLSLSMTYLKGTTADFNNPWNYHGYWRLPTRSVPISVNGRIYTVQLKTNIQSSPAFSWNGKQISFHIGETSENWADISIGETSKRIFYAFNMPDDVKCSIDNFGYHIEFPGLLRSYPEETARKGKLPVKTNGEITSPFHGKVLEICIMENQFIKKGDPLLVIESMKSENYILAHKDARIKKIAVQVGGQVTDRMPLIFLED
jgi:acetyl/propionyl-CoA carboxylase alpha subunit